MESAEVSSRENEHFDNSVRCKAATLPALICPAPFIMHPSKVRPVLSSTLCSVRLLIMPESTLTLFGTFMCELTDGDGKQFGDLESSDSRMPGIGNGDFPLRFPQWWWIGSNHMNGVL
jgi:hypothetical protein